MNDESLHAVWAKRLIVAMSIPIIMVLIAVAYIAMIRAPFVFVPLLSLMVFGWLIFLSFGWG